MDEMRSSKHAGRWAKVMMIALAACLGIGVENARAQATSTTQDNVKEPPRLGWSNDTDLSLVFTAGNSATQTWAFTDLLRHRWKEARVEFEVNVVRANASDDRYWMVTPGIEFPVGGAPANPP